MDFNLSNIKGTSNKKQLAPYKVHRVVFKGISSVSGTKTTDGQPWYAMDIKFENEEGYFNIRIFSLSDRDFERRTSKGKNGEEFTNASRAEEVSLIMAQVGEALAPEQYAKFREMKFDLPKDFSKMTTVFTQCMKKSEGKETGLKLISKNDGNSRLPYFARLNKEGELYMSTNFLGEGLTFTAAEISKMSTAPNPMPSAMETIVPSTPNNDEITEDSFNLNLF